MVESASATMVVIEGLPSLLWWLLTKQMLFINAQTHLSHNLVSEYGFEYKINVII